MDSCIDLTGLARGSDLDRRQCLRLLTGALVGRVINTEHALPAAHPVIYILRGEAVIFRAAADSKLAAAVTNAVVAFQVDDIDPASHTGWSVLGIGQAYQLSDVEYRQALSEYRYAVDMGAPAVGVFAIPLSRLTGRRFGAALRQDAVQ